ncbi:hypothetical protein E4U56_007049 [Claviceps arundinis]|uniref:DRPLA protein n=1 Tax=Claviceps arundinis TaxID=1623583 RepID=A0A9P7MWZ4_9HYPO|nr:hypothetical protein E4U56_007049 [Claviceps arundinis]
MNSPEGRGSLRVQPKRRPWTAEEDRLLVQFKESHKVWTKISDILPGRSLDSCQLRYQLLSNERERSEPEETNNKIAMAYDRLKEDIWSPIATEMSVVWREAERMHWLLGKKQMRKRGTHDSFRTTRINLPLPQVDDARVEAPGQQQDEPRQHQQQGARMPGSNWSGSEEAFLFAYRRSGMLWDDIARLLPERTAKGCHDHYFKQRATGPAWTQERKNDLCKRYERLRQIMWTKIGVVLKVPWQYVEVIHWRLGEEEIKERAEFVKERAGAALISRAAFGLALPDEHSDEANEHSDEEHDQSAYHPQHPQYQTEPAHMANEGRPGSSVTLPGIYEFLAGVPP